MISVGSRGGRKGLGLEFGAGGEMEETELEEGEASCYKNGNDSAIDPDIDLSYLDEKLKDVLGHFQKDFEGGVSAENLGSKFGGYGSFLPTYQRSPAHARSPPKVHKHNIRESPNNLHLEAFRHNSILSAAESLTGKHDPTSNSPLLPAPGATLMNATVKQDVGISSIHANESTSKIKLLNKSSYTSDLKMLKVRIKVGSDNLSTQRNAEIYCGLGLDVSPASSMDSSPAKCEGGLSCERHHSPEKSPTSILQNMISFPVHGNLLLSPLPEDMMSLTDKDKNQEACRSKTVERGSRKSFLISVNGSDPAKNDHKVLQGREPTSFEKNAFSLELKKSDANEAQNGTGVLLKKFTDIDTLACEELVLNTLKLPLLSNSSFNTADLLTSAKAVEASDGVKKDNVKGESLANEGSLDLVCAQAMGWNEKLNGNVGPAINVRETTKLQDSESSIQPRKGGKFKGGKDDVTSKADANIPKVKKSFNTEPIDCVTQQANKKIAVSEEKLVKLGTVKEHSSSGGKKKLKESQNHCSQSAEGPKDGLKNSRYSSDKYKNTPANNPEDFLKDCGKSRDTHKEFFGELDSEQVNKLMPSTCRLRDSELVKKSACHFKSILKEKFREEMNEPSTSYAYPRASPNVHPDYGNKPTSDSATVAVDFPPKDSWVGCDKCQKWRLLPLGTNPESLPEKWLCSMLDWLPGMNRCTVSEEETTKALVAQYQVPAPENHSSQHAHAAGVLPGVLPTASHFDQEHQLHDLRTGPKMKHQSKDLSNAIPQDNSLQHFNSNKNSPEASMKSRIANGLNYSPPETGLDFHRFGQSNSLAADKHRHKQKEKNKLRESYCDGGDTSNSKIRSRQVNDQELSITSKKIKREGKHYSDEGLTPDHDDSVLKDDHSLSNGLPVHASGKEWHKFNGHSTDSKFDENENLQISVRDSENQMLFTSDNKDANTGKCNDKDARKRKVNELQDTQINSMHLSSSGHHLQDGRVFMEENNGSGHRKDKKARLPRSEGKGTTVIEGSGGTGKQVTSRSDQQFGPEIGNTLAEQSLDAVDSLKQDCGSVQQSIVVTSSSSKVSGSNKNKANLQEVKGSPVESVSSSPMRNLNPEKSTSKRRDLVGSGDSQYATFVASSSPKRCSDGKYNGIDRSGTERKDATCTATRHECLPSELDVRIRDFDNKSSNKTKLVSSSELSACDATNVDVHTLGQGTRSVSNLKPSDQCRDEERVNNGPRERKSSKGSSSETKDKNLSCLSELDNCKLKSSDSFNESVDHASSYEESSRSGRNKFHDKFGFNSDRVEKNFASKKRSPAKLLSEHRKRDSQINFEGHDGSDVRVDDNSSQDHKHNILLGHDTEKASKMFVSDRTDRMEVSERGKSHGLPPSGRFQAETLPIPESKRENKSNNLGIDGSEGEGTSKAQNHITKSENQNGNQSANSRHITSNGNKVRDFPSPLQRDAPSQAATNAVKEAKDLKHLADRLKNSGSTLESTGLYFQAALKFLHGASLLESCNSDNAKHGEMIQSMRMYSSTAKLCEFCAHEYEKYKDMASAALAYKCMEVAYLRVIYSSHNNATKDRHELQTALHIVPPGESPSSSASDVDNLHNPATADKTALYKCVSSPQVAGNHVITAQNRSSFLRLLDFTQDVHFAMEASKKSRIAFAAANPRLEQTQYKEGISSVKKALDFNFQDVEGLLRLVRLAMEAISR